MFYHQGNNCSKESVDQSSTWILMGFYIAYQSKERGSYELCNEFFELGSLNTL